MTTPRPSVTVQRTRLKVATSVGVQQHPRYTAYVRIPGDREVHRCCGRHQKPGPARECGERLAKRLWNNAGS